MSEGTPIAEVVLTQGRWFLVVRGVYVAMEGDPCVNRDPAYAGRNWDRMSLEEAAQDINVNRFGSAKERWEGRGGL
jgi:hypothetical protein